MLGGLVSFMLVGTRGVLFLLGFAMLVWWFGGFMLLLWQIFRGFRLVLICFVCWYWLYCCVDSVDYFDVVVCVI